MNDTFLISLSGVLAVCAIRLAFVGPDVVRAALADPSAPAGVWRFGKHVLRSWLQAAVRL